MTDRRSYNSTLRPVSDKRKGMKRRHNSTFGAKSKPKKVMSIEELKASGLVVKASKLSDSKSEKAKWKDKADKWFSEFIRLRDAGPNGRVTCITCSHTDHWRYLQCGHYVTRGHGSTRFDEKNCNTQCRGCNYNGGQHMKHATAIDRKHGAGTAEALEQKGRMRTNRTVFDYQFIANTYKARVFWIRQHEPEKYESPKP